MTPFTIVAYLLLCVMVALLGRRSRLGFFRGLLFSVMLTPLVIMLYLLIFGSTEERARRE